MTKINLFNHNNNQLHMYKTKISDPNQNYNVKKNQLKILVVDDDELSRESLKDMIMLRGHDVTTLEEGMKCVNRCSQIIFDLIFMDYHIEDIGGDESLGEVDGSIVTDLVKEGNDSDPHIYAYTGDNSTKVIKKCKEKGMKGMFIKPVDYELIKDFLNIVESNPDDTIKLKKLALKRKNFVYFSIKPN